MPRIRSFCAFVVLATACSADDTSPSSPAGITMSSHDASSSGDTGMRTSKDGSASVHIDAAVPASATCPDHTWPCWPMPNPASANLPNPSKYVDGGDGTVKDAVTGLVWQKDVPSMTYNWADAITYCTGLALAGGGWHLPTRIELLSITDYTHTGPAIDTTAFPKTPSAFFWTSSPWVVSQISTKPQDTWIVNFYEGLTSNAGGRDGQYHVRCVR